MQRLREREWPTLALIGTTSSIWLIAIACSNALVPWILLPIAAVMVTLHSSLQHEVLHGHPTRNNHVNEALIYFGIGLFIPYRRFKALHMRHHNDDRLTDPYDDPESFYLAWREWNQLPKLLQGVLTINNTLLGRLTIGPLVSVVGFYGAELRLLRQNAPGVRRGWMHHALGLVPVVVFVKLVGGIDIWVYALCVAYPGMSLLMLRTYAEHRAHEHPEGRSIIVEFCPVFSLLFLNNNLHLVHHTHPREAWYRLPALYKQNRGDWHRRNDGYVFTSYLALARQYLLRIKEPVAHPMLKNRDVSN